LSHPPLTHTHGYYTKGTLLFILLVLTALIYAATTAHCIYPGASAAAMAKVAGLLPEVRSTHPLWLGVSKLVAMLPVGSLALRLNYFSALCGMLSILLLFKITSMLIYEMLFDKTSYMLTPDENLDNPDNVRNTAPYEFHRDPDAADMLLHSVANYGGMAAAFALSFCAPFWLASTSFHLVTFETMLFLLTLVIALHFILYGSSVACLIAFLLCGAGIVESGMYCIPLLAILFFIAKAAIQYELLTDSFVLLLLASLMLGTALTLSILLVLDFAECGIDSARILPLLKNLALSHLNDIRGLLPRSGWALILLQALIPLAISIKGIKQYFTAQDEIARLKWFILFLIMTAAALYLLFNLPGSAWNLARNGSYLPVPSYICLALTIGLVVTYWILLSRETMTHLSVKMTRSPLLMRVAAVLSLFAIGGSLCLTIPLNYSDCDGNQADFFDATAHRIMAEARHADYLVADNFYYMHLILLNMIEKAGLVIVNEPPLIAAPRRASNPDDKKATFRLLTNSSDFTRQNDISSTLYRWMRSRLNAGKTIAFLTHPRALSEEYRITPQGFLYYAHGALSADLKGDLAEAKDTHDTEQSLQILSSGTSGRPLLIQAQAHIRSHIGRLTNARGVFLENAGVPAAALAAYTRSLKINPDNLTTLFNLYGFYLKHGTAQEINEYTQRITARIGDDGMDNLTAEKIVPAGVLFSQPPDIVFAQALNAVSGKRDSERILALLHHWHRLYDKPSASTPLSLGFSAPLIQIEPDLFLSETVKVILNGETERAVNLLRGYLYRHPKNMSAWTLLAQIHLQTSDFTAIEQSILPKMYEIDAAGNPYIFMVEGCYQKHKPQPDLQQARSFFLKALQAAAPLPAACAELLDTDRRIGAADLLKQDAQRILAIFPDHPQANMLLGSYHLSRKELDQAESYLKRSIASEPMPQSFNDLAEVNRLKGNPDTAEQYARRAIRSAPFFTPAWDTLGNTLLQQERLDEAEKVIRFAITLNPDDHPPYLSLADICIRKGEHQRAANLLQRIKPNLNTDNASVMNLYLNLVNQLRLHNTLVPTI